MNPTNEPVATSAVVTILSVLVARFGFHASPDQLAAVATVVVAIANYVARRFVSPTKKA